MANTCQVLYLNLLQIFISETISCKTFLLHNLTIVQIVGLIIQFIIQITFLGICFLWAYLGKVINYQCSTLNTLRSNWALNLTWVEIHPPPELRIVGGIGGTPPEPSHDKHIENWKPPLAQLRMPMEPWGIIIWSE